METFLALNQIFTIDELRKAVPFKKDTSTVANLLTHHLKKGRILRIRQGLYYTVPPGSNPETCLVDSYIVTAKMTKDAVLAYHTVLGFYGYLHSMRNDRVYLTRRKTEKPFFFQGVFYKGVSIPRKIASKSDFEVKTVERMGIKIRITSLERAFVDMIDRPSLTGEWEEIWRSLESIEYLDLEKVFEYICLLNNATTSARVAFFLETHREEWHVSEKLLRAFESHRPKNPHYLDRNSKEPQQLVSRWNLIVPKSILQKTWEEPHGDI